MTPALHHALALAALGWHVTRVRSTPAGFNGTRATVVIARGDRAIAVNASDADTALEEAIRSARGGERAA